MCALILEWAFEKFRFSVSSKRWILTSVPSSPGMTRIRPSSTSSSMASFSGWSSLPFLTLLAYSVSLSFTCWMLSFVGFICVYWVV